MFLQNAPKLFSQTGFLLRVQSSFCHQNANASSMTLPSYQKMYRNFCSLFVKIEQLSIVKCM